MTILEAVAHAKETLASANQELERIEYRLRQHIQNMGGAMPSASPKPAPKPSAPITPITTPAPRQPDVFDYDVEFPGEGHPLVRRAIREAAAICGYYPSAVEGIQVWETGHYDDPDAGPWLYGNNPGGMIYNKDLVDDLGALPEPYLSENGSTKFFKWATWYRGIIGHGLFLKRKNYDGARAPGLTGGQQVKATWDANYSAKDPKWLDQVTKLEAKLAKFYGGQPSTAPAPPPTSLSLAERRAKVVAIARDALGRGIEYELGTGGGDPNGPWPKKMDCSALGNRCVGISRDKTNLNTDATLEDGDTPGGYYDDVPDGEAVPSDLLVDGKGDGHKWGHMGVITEVVNGRPTRMIDCADGRDPAIQEVSTASLLKRGGRVVRARSLAA